MPPFLEIVTRTFNGRPRMFAAHKASLAAQTDQDFVHTILVDTERKGIAWATENLARHAPRLVGDYVFVLDDDDMLILPTFVAGLKQIATQHNPDLIMVRMDHGGGRILPAARWGKSPRVSEIGISAFVVRREWWKRHAHAMIPGEYTSDFKFIESIWVSYPEVFWWDTVASRCQRQSVGLAEMEKAA
jgi:hypothetical protein